MAKKVKWRRTRDGEIRFVEKRTSAQRMAGTDFSSVAMFTFALSVILVAVTIAAASLYLGNAPSWIAYPPAAALVLSALGTAATWYGHFQARADSRFHWFFCLLTNGGMTLILLGFYIAGSWM